MVNTPAGIRDIYGVRAHSKFLKSKHYDVMSHQVANTFTHRGGKDHMRRRRIMSQGFSGQAQREYEPRIASHVDKFCRTVLPETDGGWSEPLDMSKWCNYLSFDIMADLIFGAQYDLLGTERFRYMPEVIEKSNVRISALVQFPRLTWLRLDKHLFREAIFARNRFLNFVMRLVRDRMALSKGSVCGIYGNTVKVSGNGTSTSYKPSDVYSKLEMARDPHTGVGFRPHEIASESTTLVVAGSDTSACTIASVLFYLADNPTAYAKAAEEVRAKVSTRSDITGGNLAPCIYLRSCIDEALRMSPAVGTALVREVVASEGTTVGGHFLPAGMEVGVGSYSVHHNTESFPDPFSYKPERWLETHTSRESIDRARATFVPFSSGTRSCLGKGLAYTEITLVVATLLFLGDFKFAEGDLGRVGRGNKDDVYGRHRENEYQLHDHIAGQKKGPWLQFSRREGY